MEALASRLPCASVRLCTPRRASQPAPRPALRCAFRRVSSRRAAPRAAASSDAPLPLAPLGPRDDDVLPDSLFDAVKQAAASTSAAIGGGRTECMVEILVPELFDTTSGNIMAQEGDQQRVWELCRFFVEGLASELGAPAGGVRAVFPDAGCAALLAQRWKGQVSFGLASLDDRSPQAQGLTALVICAPDPQGADASERLAAAAAEAGAACVVLNPRLASGDAGIGLNARRTRERFTSRLAVTYCLRPVGDGTVFRRFPGPYQVFAADMQQVGRYRLIAQLDSRPGGEELAEMLDAAERERDGRGSFAPDGTPRAMGFAEAVVDNLSKTVGSMMRFMNSLK